MLVRLLISQADDKLDAFGGSSPDINQQNPIKSRPMILPTKSIPKQSVYPKKPISPDYDSSGSEVTGKYGMQSTAYDPNYNGPEGYPQMMLMQLKDL